MLVKEDNKIILSKLNELKPCNVTLSKEILGLVNTIELTKEEDEKEKNNIRNNLYRICNRKGIDSKTMDRGISRIESEGDTLDMTDIRDDLKSIKESMKEEYMKQFIKNY